MAAAGDSWPGAPTGDRGGAAGAAERLQAVLALSLSRSLPSFLLLLPEPVARLVRRGAVARGAAWRAARRPLRGGEKAPPPPSPPPPPPPGSGEERRAPTKQGPGSRRAPPGRTETGRARAPQALFGSQLVPTSHRGAEKLGRERQPRLGSSDEPWAPPAPDALLLPRGDGERFLARDAGGASSPGETSQAAPARRGSGGTPKGTRRLRGKPFGRSAQSNGGNSFPGERGGGWSGMVRGGGRAAPSRRIDPMAQCTHTL
ncbi:uncharacterized protein LOC144327446 [Podarcis muralis]